MRDTIQGQLRDAGWSLKEAREAVDAFSTVYDPINITPRLEIIFPKDTRIKAFAIVVNQKSAVVVIKIQHGKFLAKKQAIKLARGVVASLKFVENKNITPQKKELIKKKIIIEKTDESNIENNNLYYETNLIEGKIEKGDTLLARLIALGEKKVVIRKALKVLSKKMNPNIVRSGSSIIVALGRDKSPMKGFFIEKSRKRGY